MLKVYTINSVKESRLTAGKSISAPLFEGDMTVNLSATKVPYKTITSASSSEVLRQEIEELRYKGIQATMSAQNPSAAEIEALFGKTYIEATRVAKESPDLTSLIAMETVNFDFSENPTLREISPYRGIMKTVAGNNDAVSLIEQNLGNTDTVALTCKAVGWKDTIMNMLYNKAYSLDKIIKAATDADTDERNKATAGVMIGATWVASNQQAAVTTSGLTLDEKTYETVLAAVKKLRALKDVQTGRKISAPRIHILCNSADTWQLENVIRGQLNGNGSTARTSNRPALPIDAIIEYDQGINHGFVIGKETASYPGVTAGKFYLFVPDVLLVASKRPLTMETGKGTVLELSTQEYAWYRVQGVYSKTFLGSSYPGTSVGADFGFALEVSMPS